VRLIARHLFTYGRRCANNHRDKRVDCLRIPPVKTIHVHRRFRLCERTGARAHPNDRRPTFCDWILIAGRRRGYDDNRRHRSKRAGLLPGAVNYHTRRRQLAVEGTYKRGHGPIIAGRPARSYSENGISRPANIVVTKSPCP